MGAAGQIWVKISYFFISEKLYHKWKDYELESTGTPQKRGYACIIRIHRFIFKNFEGVFLSFQFFQK